MIIAQNDFSGKSVLDTLKQIGYDVCGVMQMKIDDLVKRINELAHKAKAEGLTPEETAERDALRKEYVEAFRRSLTAQLDNTYILRPDGTKEKLKRNS